jgi:DNA ligase D-like protein (predicted ligase)
MSRVRRAAPRGGGGGRKRRARSGGSSVAVASPADPRRLPAFIDPMLARASKPFDSPDYLFEIKWDGTRALCFRDGAGVRLVNRRNVEISGRYPELVEALNVLPAGTVLDGEVVVLKGGKPDFAALQSREHTATPAKIGRLAKLLPANYMVFDQLYEAHEPIVTRPLTERRKVLQWTMMALETPRVLMSQGVTGAGKAYFQQARELELEGVVAKRLDSRYEPGQRSASWLKIKRFENLACAVIGFVPEGQDDFGSLVIAIADDETGVLRCVGRVGSGFDAARRAKANRFLWSHLREKPVVPSREKARWVEPGLYCVVRCMEQTQSGQLRAPVFVDFHDAG